MRNKMPHETNFDDSGPGQLKQIFPVLSLANSGQSTDQFELARPQLLRTMTLLGKAAPDTEIIPPIFISSGDEPNGALRDCLESFEVKSPHLREDMLAVKRLARRALYGNKNLKAFMDENGWQPAKETGRSGDPAPGNGTCSEYE